MTNVGSISLNAFIHHRIINPVKSLLKHGLTPSSLALCLSVGFVLGVSPILGITTMLCIVAAGSLRLNQVAIQIANYCSYPLQFILFIPFIRLGEKLFGLKPVSIDPLMIFELAKNDFGIFLERYGVAISAAFVAWLLVAIPTVLLMWKGLTIVLTRKTGE